MEPAVNTRLNNSVDNSTQVILPMSTLKHLSDIHSLVDVGSQSAVVTDQIESTEIPDLTSTALMAPGFKIVDTSWQTIKKNY